MLSLRFLLALSAVAGVSFLTTWVPDFGDTVGTLPPADSETNRITTPPHPTPRETPAEDRGIDAHLRGGSEVGEWSSFDAMHDAYTEAFVNSEGFGIARRLTFDSPERRHLWVNDRPMRVESTELISLMSGEPFAYVASWMNPLRTALEHSQHRMLTEFEVHAIERIRQGRPHAWQARDVSVGEESMPGGVLVAPLRANDGCVACHEVEPGALLGAFAYTLMESGSRLTIPATLMQTDRPKQELTTNTSHD